MTTIDTYVDEFLRRTLVAVISTVDNSGRPRSAPIWFHWEDGAAYMFTGRNTLKWRNIQLYPYASLCVDWREPPYKSIILDGSIEEVERPLYELVLLMALRYYGREEGAKFAEDYKDQSKNVAVFRLVPERVANYLDKG
jgi:nitroimidazol reductase NimA-like FMN-containing flavoprotein (pyridoxamine 5'-phosphate oxidase superfamily)